MVSLVDWASVLALLCIHQGKNRCRLSSVLVESAAPQTFYLLFVIYSIYKQAAAGMQLCSGIIHTNHAHVLVVLSIFVVKGEILRSTDPGGYATTCNVPGNRLGTASSVRVR